MKSKRYKKMVDSIKKRGPSKFPSVVIPNFVFTDGTMDTFTGFDRLYSIGDGRTESDTIWVMSLFDIKGNYFKIEVDKRKAKLKKQVTFIHDGTAYYYSIVGFYTIGATINPLNGHLIGCRCGQCLAGEQTATFAS